MQRRSDSEFFFFEGYPSGDFLKQVSDLNSKIMLLGVRCFLSVVQTEQVPDSFQAY
jgi:hypothetical protein